MYIEINVLVFFAIVLSILTVVFTRSILKDIRFRKSDVLDFVRYLQDEGVLLIDAYDIDEHVKNYFDKWYEEEYLEEECN